MLVVLLFAGCAPEARDDPLVATSTTEPDGRDVELVSCGPGDHGRMVAGLRVVNRSSERSNYSVGVAFVSEDGGEQFDTAYAMVRALEPGQSAAVDAVSYQQEPAFRCEVVDVTRYAVR